MLQEKDFLRTILKPFSFKLQLWLLPSLSPEQLSKITETHSIDGLNMVKIDEIPATLHFDDNNNVINFEIDEDYQITGKIIFDKFKVVGYNLFIIYVDDLCEKKIFAKQNPILITHDTNISLRSIINDQRSDGDSN